MLLPFSSKIFENIKFNSFSRHLDKNNPLNSNQSRFRPGNSCVYPLLSISNDL